MVTSLGCQLDPVHHRTGTQRSTDPDTWIWSTQVTPWSLQQRLHSYLSLIPPEVVILLDLIPVTVTVCRVGRKKTSGHIRKDEMRRGERNNGGVQRAGKRREGSKEEGRESVKNKHIIKPCLRLNSAHLGCRVSSHQHRGVVTEQVFRRNWTVLSCFRDYYFTATSLEPTWSKDRRRFSPDLKCPTLTSHKPCLQNLTV